MSREMAGGLRTQPAMAPFHDAWLCETRAPVTPAVPVPLDVFAPVMTVAAGRLRRVLLAWPGSQVPDRPVIGTDDHHRAVGEPQAGARHRPHGLRRLPGLESLPGRSQDQQLRVRCPVEQGPGGQLVR
jgi:hypothetical protein